ncbi:entericidin [Agrobacterium sp. ES01]|uniref:entericidin domain-containing protein n=1 Tax=Agrobacterium sp. ES01 TaxID=3420714 RepID=UPI003D0A052C
MKFAKVFALTAIGIMVLVLSGCGNTIRGVGRDTANAVDATQDAAVTVERSTY